jgi:hypothetical protein
MKRIRIPLAQGTGVGCLLLAAAVHGAPKAFTVGGTVTGLRGSGLILSIERTQASIGANGQFVLPTLASSGQEYSVKVVQQPKSPAQSCAVVNGTGAVSNADVTNIVVDCVTQGHWRTASQVDRAGGLSGHARVAGEATQIAMDPQGNGMVVWETSAGVWSARYVAASGWQAPELIGSGPGTRRATVDVDSLGNAVAVWDQPIGGRRLIWANRFTTSAGWGIAAPIESHLGGDAGGARVSLSANGDALAIWQQRSDALNTLSIWALRFSPAGLGVPQRISDGAGAADNLEIARDTQGNAVAVWEQFDVADNVSVWSNRFENGQ